CCKYRATASNPLRTNVISSYSVSSTSNRTPLTSAVENDMHFILVQKDIFGMSEHHKAVPNVGRSMRHRLAGRGLQSHAGRVRPRGDAQIGAAADAGIHFNELHFFLVPKTLHGGKPDELRPLHSASRLAHNLRVIDGLSDERFAAEDGHAQPWHRGHDL